MILKYAEHPRINHKIDPAVFAAATVYYVQKQAEIGNTVEITMQRVADRQAVIAQMEQNLERLDAEGERLDARLARLDALIQATQQTIDMVRGM